MNAVRNTRFPVFVYFAALIIVLLVGAASLVFGIPIKRMLVEAVQIYQSKFYLGFLSNLTAITWAAGAYCSLFAWWLIRKCQGPADWQRFFLFAGSLTTILMLDDLFMFHERIFPKHLYLHLLFGREPNEKIPIACYGLFTIYFLYSSRHVIAKTRWEQLVLALGLLAFSVVIDRGIGSKLVPSKDLQTYLEEGAKFLGVVGWSSYYILHAAAVTARLYSPANAEDAEPDTSVAEEQNPALFSH